MDWDDLRYFLAVARHGTVTAAARALEVAQPTVGRRVTSFEARLGAKLFVRSPAGWGLTAVGRGMLAHAERMEEHALTAETLAAGRDAGLDGSVRISASEWVIRSILGPALAPFVVRHPSLSLELVAEARHASLVRREADLAIRPSKFSHQDVVQRQIGTIEFGLYASDAYLARHGAPDFTAGCPGHVLIAMSDDVGNVADREWLPPITGRARVAVRTNGREPMATMAAAGMGITCLPRFVGDATPGLRLVTTPTPAPRRALWIGVHREARSTPRIRATLTHIAESFGHLRQALCPTEGDPR
jgi:DNA-binding transcriptional LysR family regulator